MAEKEVILGRPYRRHIIVDNISRTIWIEVQPALNGNLKLQEFQDIKNGVWWKYVPKEEIEQFRHAITNGFTVRPMVNSGGMNEQFYIIQLVDIEVQKPAMS